MAEKKLNVILARYTVDAEELVALAAKLCYSPADLTDLMKKISEKDQEGFVEKLINMGHMSPVEHINFTFAVEGISRACSHQLVRHRLASYSQQSQRYVGEQGEKNEDKVFDYIIPKNVRDLNDPALTKVYGSQMKTMQGFYDFWIRVFEERVGIVGGDAYQDARFVLPNAAETKIFITMNARELLHFFRVRCCLRAQWEVRAMAEKMLKLVLEKCPIIFKGAGPACVGGPCDQGKMNCGQIKEVRERFQAMKK